MTRYWPALCLVAIVIFGPVGLRVLSWHAPRQAAVQEDMVAAGEMLFKHEWQVHDPLSNGGDGLGPVFNAKSCLACHHQNGAGGSGGIEHNVTTYLVTPVEGEGDGKRHEGVLHSHAIPEKHRETLTHIHASLPAISQPLLSQIVSLSSLRGNSLTIPTNVRLSQRKTPALFGIGLIDLIPDRVIVANAKWQSLGYGMAPGDGESIPVGRVHRLANGKIGRFGWKAQTPSLSDFVQAACANELGLGNPNQPQPASMAMLNYKAPGLDLTQKQCDQITAYVASLPRPIEKGPTHPDQFAQAKAGKALFMKVGCAGCHTPDLGSVEGLYSDLLLHRMGPTLEGGSAYYGPPPDIASTSSASSGPLLDEWRTPPLWNVGNSAPYMHDGRAATLEDAIKMHGGQGAKSAANFESLSPVQQAQVTAFLRTLKTP